MWILQDLKYKILVKNKKLKAHIETEGAAGTEVEESVDDEDEEDEEEEEDHQTKAKFWSPRKAGSTPKVSQLDSGRRLNTICRHLVITLFGLSLSLPLMYE